MLTTLEGTKAGIILAGPRTCLDRGDLLRVCSLEDYRPAGVDCLHIQEDVGGRRLPIQAPTSSALWAPLRRRLQRMLPRRNLIVPLYQSGRLWIFAYLQTQQQTYRPQPKPAIRVLELVEFQINGNTPAGNCAPEISKNVYDPERPRQTFCASPSRWKHPEQKKLRTQMT